MSWSSSFDSRIYNYLCNHCLSPLTLWVWIPLRRGVLDTTLCDKVCQWLATCRWFPPRIPVSSIHKTDRRDITEILLKLALNTITPNLHPQIHVMMAFFPSTAFIVLISFYSVPLFFRRKYGMQYLSKWRCYFTWKYTIQLSLYCSLLFLCEKRR
jgi:hypothetical protein